MLSMNSWIPGAWLLATAARTSRESEATARSVAQSDACPVAIHGPSRVVPRAGVARGDAIERAGGREAEKPRLRDAPAERRERVGVAQVQRAASSSSSSARRLRSFARASSLPVPPRAAFNIFGDDHDASGRVLLGRRSRLALERVALRGERAGVPGRVAAARPPRAGTKGFCVVAGREVVAMRRQRGVRAPDERAGEHRTPEPRAAEEAHGARRGSSAPGSGSLLPRRAKEALRGADRPLRGVDENSNDDRAKSFLMARGWTLMRPARLESPTNAPRNTACETTVLKDGRRPM